MPIQRSISHPPLSVLRPQGQTQQAPERLKANAILPYMMNQNALSTMKWYLKPVDTTLVRRSLNFVPLSLGQLHQILDLSSDDEALCDLRDVVVIVSNTGIRPGELKKLLWADVDMHGCKLTIAGITGVHWVPFGPKTLQMLQSRRERHPEAKFVLGKSPRGLLRRLFLQLRKVCDGIGVPGVALNVLRRTFFVRLLSAGASVECLSTIGGYKLVAKSFLSADRRLEMAARDQAQIEEL